jgi:hypothetical protein
MKAGHSDAHQEYGRQQVAEALEQETGQEVARHGDEQAQLHDVFLAFVGSQDTHRQGEQPKGQGAKERDQAPLGRGDAEDFLGNANKTAAHIAEAHHIEGQQDHQKADSHAGPRLWSGPIPAKVRRARTPQPGRWPAQGGRARICS